MSEEKTIVTSTIFGLKHPGEYSEKYHYSRYGNPNRDHLEDSLAKLDSAKHCSTYSSKVAACLAVLSTLETNDLIILDDIKTCKLLQTLMPRLRMESKQPDEITKSLHKQTKMVWIETAISAGCVRAIADVVHSTTDAFLVVDNTFVTPHFCKPIQHGADIVVYSLGEFIAGHGDVEMGSVATNSDEISEKLRYYQYSSGAIPSPFECFLVMRSLKTLALRMEKHSQNSYEVAKFLESHPKIEKVFHPSMKTHEKHEIALAQSYGHSGIMAFHIKGSYVNTKKFFQNLKLVLVTQSLGGVETNASFPWTMSHSDLPEDERIKAGVTDTLVRLSVGVGDVDEIIEDLEKALMEV